MKDGLTLLANVHKPCRAFLTSQDYVREVLFGISESIGLTPVKHTFTCHFFPAPKGDYGLSAQVILLESHIYLHTWPEIDYARVNLSSCRQFAVEQAINSLALYSRGEIDYLTVGWDHKTSKKMRRNHT